MKRYFTLLIFLFGFCLLNFQNCFSQWQQVGNINGNVYALAVSTSNIFAGNDDGVYLSTNNGENWSLVSSNIQYVRCMSILNNNVFVGCVNGRGIYVSTNSGVNWSQTLNNQDIRSLTTSGVNVFAGSNENGIFRSTNNGQNWAQTALNTQGVYSLTISGNKIFAGCIASNGVYVSTNNGINWTQTSLNNQNVIALGVLGNNIFAGTDNGIYLSTNNGVNWSQTVLNNTAITSIAISSTNIFAGTSTKGVYMSTNYGQNWIQKNQGLQPEPPNINIFNLLIANNYIFASAYRVWRRSFQEIIAIQNISSKIPSSFSLYQNYPNPFNPSTKIKFDIAKTGFTVLKVYDLVGKEVQILVNEELSSGVYEVAFDGIKLTSGVYFYRLNSGEYSETKRMLLLK